MTTYFEMTPDEFHQEIMMELGDLLLRIVADPTMPRDQIELRDDNGRTLVRVVNVGIRSPQANEAAPGDSRGHQQGT